MCQVVAGDAVPIPTLLALTSNANKFVSNVRSVPDLARLALNICPVILPIAIVYPLIDILVLAKLMVFISKPYLDSVKYH